MKIYLVCDKTKRALPIGRTEWIEGEIPTDPAAPDYSERVQDVVARCAPHVETARRAYGEEISHFSNGNSLCLLTGDDWPEGYARVSGYWQTAYIERPKSKRRNVRAV